MNEVPASFGERPELGSMMSDLCLYVSNFQSSGALLS